MITIIMDKREIEKSKLGFKTIEDFFMQFGDNIYTRILLEEILEGVMNAETLFISGEQEQEGNQIGDSAPDREQRECQQQDQRSVGFEFTNKLPEKDREDYL